MPGRVTHVLGLDIGNDALKAVELRLTSQGIELLGAPAVVRTPDGSVAGGVVVDSAAVAAALRDMVRSRGFGAKNVVTAVGGDTSSVVRIIEMPRMTGKELREGIKWELDRQTPFPVDNVASDYQQIVEPDLPPDAQNMQVLLAVAQDEMVSAHVATLMAAKLTPIAIDIEPLALSRALVNSANGRYTEQTVCICNIGATNTGIYFIRKGVLNFARTIPTAGETITSAIRQNVARSDEEAEQFKKEFVDLTGAHETGAPVVPQGASEELRIARQEIYEVVSPVVLDLATEIRRSIEYYRRQHHNEEVNEVFLSGGTALIPGLADFVAAETGVLTQTADPFANLHLEQDTDLLAYLRDVAPLMTIAVGLAMRDMIE